MKILITGSNGLLGQKLVAFCVKRNYPFLATSKGENRNPGCPNGNYFPMDITNKLEINGVFASFYPTHVIHTAALTQVDHCEEHQQECSEVNVQGTNYLFDVAQRHEAHFMLLSTDFVFDGEQGNYAETDAVNPLSFYAKSKVEAEQLLIQSTYPNWSIVRTIIIFGTANNLSRSNFVLWVMDSLSKKMEIRVVEDQFRSPTRAEDLAWGCLEILERNKIGTYHLSGKEYLSMYEFALRIADFYGLDKQLIYPVLTVGLNEKAKRPPKTGFDLSKAKRELDYEPKSVSESLGLIRLIR